MRAPRDPLTAFEEELLLHAQWARDIAWEPTEIVDRLFVGGAPDGDTMLTATASDLGQAWSPSAHAGLYDAVVTVAASVGPAGTGVLEMRAGYVDIGGGKPDPRLLAQAVASGVAWHRAGLRVLIRCRAGMNRSALVAALVLVIDQGMDFVDAVALLRSRRHALVLSNEDLRMFGAVLAVDRGFNASVAGQLPAHLSRAPRCRLEETRDEAGPERFSG